MNPPNLSLKLDALDRKGPHQPAKPLKQQVCCEKLATYVSYLGEAQS